MSGQRSRGTVRQAMRALSPWRSDVLLAGAFLVAGVIDLADGSIDHNPRWLAAMIVVVLSAGLVVRRRLPLVPVFALAVAEIPSALVGKPVDDLWAFVLLLLTGYSVAAYAGKRTAIFGAVVIFTAVMIAGILDPTGESGEAVLSPLALTLAPWLAGRLARRYSEQAEELAQANRELEERRAQEVEHALETERARIAQELHDVIAHSLSVMVVQAGAAEQDADGRQRDALESIRRTGKGALAEMRRLLGVLRADNGLHPQPGVAELPGMVDRIRAAGVDVALDLDPALPALQPGPDLVVYRVVQEALTNTLKHAGASAARVTVVYEGGAVAIEATDSGGPGGSGDGSGHGLLGMRERLALYDGTLESGPANGGWRLRARLPVSAEALR